MMTLQHVLLLLHLVGMAALVGGFLAVVKSPRPIPAMVWGARAQLLTGLALVGLSQSQQWMLNNAWVGVKLVIAVIVCGLLEVAAGKESNGEKNPRLVQIAGVLAIVNVMVATLWTS